MLAPLPLPLDEAWRTLLATLLTDGQPVSPRGLPTLELPQVTLAVDASRAVLTNAARKLGYRFMAAEAYWLLTGDDRVATIAPYNERIKEFSDDGRTFFGAYGPQFIAQLGHVVRALHAEESTRQAVMTLWRPSPPPTRDAPCTVAISFQVRQRRLNAHAFMRSSDAWLGVPYDAFNLAMVTYYLNGLLNIGTTPGCVYLTMASSHLYRSNLEAAEACLSAPASVAGPVPVNLAVEPRTLLWRLRLLRDERAGSALRWWEINDDTASV